MIKKNIKILIVEDDNDFSEILVLYLNDLGFHDIKLTNSYNQAIEEIATFTPEIALLDINLKGQKTGVDVGLYVREAYPEVPIIYFTNNFTEAIFEAAAQTRPTSFLDKQIDKLKVQQAVELALLQKDFLKTQSKENDSSFYITQSYFFIKVGAIFKKIEFKDIDYIVYSDRYSNVVIEQKKYPLNIPMKDLIKKLPSNGFIQIHQSYIINLDKIKQYSSIDNQVEIAGQWLPIGTSFRKSFQEKLMFLS